MTSEEGRAWLTSVTAVSCLFIVFQINKIRLGDDSIGNED